MLKYFALQRWRPVHLKLSTHHFPFYTKVPTLHVQSTNFQLEFQLLGSTSVRARVVSPYLRRSAEIRWKTSAGGSSGCHSRSGTWAASLAAAPAAGTPDRSRRCRHPPPILPWPPQDTVTPGLKMSYPPLPSALTLLPPPSHPPAPAECTPSVPWTEHGVGTTQPARSCACNRHWTSCPAAVCPRLSVGSPNASPPTAPPCHPSVATLPPAPRFEWPTLSPNALPPLHLSSFHLPQCSLLSASSDLLLKAPPQRGDFSCWTPSALVLPVRSRHCTPILSVSRLQHPLTLQ